MAMEYNPDPPMPSTARKTMSWFIDWARPLAREKPENRTQAVMTAHFRPIPSLILAKIREKHSTVLVEDLSVRGHHKPIYVSR